MIRPLGHTDMAITRVGLGGAGWDRQDDAVSIATIRHAVEHGVNWIDTAAVYGRGRSERTIRAALVPFAEADRPYVFTKCGHVWDPAEPSAPARRIGDPAVLRREVEDSLRRLGVERIDLYQMHCPPDDGTPLAEYWSTLLDLKAEGKVRAVGLSNHRGRQLAAAAALGRVDTLQPPFSAVNREIAADLPWCERHGTGVLAYSPMQSGLLTGRFTVERAEALPPHDWRSRVPEFGGARLRRNLALAEDLLPVARRHGVDVAAVACAWTLAWPGVTGAIVGARRPDQADGWLPALTLVLTEADLAEITAAIHRTGAGAGPVSPERGWQVPGPEQR